jgi:N-acetylmuramoyl-L-alanine amidase
VHDKQVLADIASVMLGLKAPPNPHPVPYLHRRWPAFMGPGHYFGLITGPDESHGGAIPNERPYVRAIQLRLVKLGYLHGPILGHFGKGTADAVARWQRKECPGTTRFGEVWPDDFRRLFTF